MNARRFAYTVALLAACSGCDEPSPSVDPTPGTASPVAPASSATGAAIASAPSASAAAVVPPAPPAPTAWTGHYDAKVGEVNPPASAREKAWTTDPGTAAIGKGTIELAVVEKGVVHGSASGPLGDLVVSGELDGEELRANLAPKEPNGEQAMFGVLSLAKDGEKLHGTLRTSDREAKIVREATVELSPK